MRHDRIAGLTIEGFRGFTTPQSLAFNSQDVFIFGENGHGKSSIIEAIQWCLFGGSDIQVRNSVYEKQECRVLLRLEGGCDRAGRNPTGASRMAGATRCSFEMSSLSLQS
jgi:recombinational DNA repair ATPase RecF